MFFAVDKYENPIEKFPNATAAVNWVIEYNKSMSHPSGLLHVKEIETTCVNCDKQMTCENIGKKDVYECWIAFKKDRQMCIELEDE